MKQIVKNAIVYKAHLPRLEVMQKTLDNEQFTPPGSMETLSYGFVPVGETEDKVVSLNHDRTSGYAFAVRIDTKVVPASAVNEELKRLVAEWEDQTGYTAGRERRKGLREAAISACVAKALCRSSVITCLYNTQEKFLFVNTTSKIFADHVMKLLVRTMESVKTETIHVSGISNSLTTRVTAWLGDEYDGEELFAGLEPCDSILLQSAGGKITFLVDDLLGSATAINQVLHAGFIVKAMGLSNDFVSFKLTDDFMIKGFKLNAGMERGHAEDPYEQFQQQAYYELGELTRIVNALIQMFDYKEPTFESEPEGTDVPDTVTDESDEADQLDDDPTDDDDWGESEDEDF